MFKFSSSIVSIQIKQIPVIQQPAVVQLLDFLEEFLCLCPHGYFLCSYHRAGFQFSPVIHPFFDFKIRHQLLINFYLSEYFDALSISKGKNRTVGNSSPSRENNRRCWGRKNLHKKFENFQPQMLWRENIENGQSQGEKDAGHKLVVVTQGTGI